MRLLSVLTLLLLTVFSLAAGFPPPYAKEPPAGTEIVHPGDGAIMVWVPSGYFTMGMDREKADKAIKDLGYKGGWEEAWAWEWAPERKVYVAGYFIDKYEVDWAQWMKFAVAFPQMKMKTPRGPVEKVPGEFSLYPASSVLWAEAQKYVNWAGKQLPYEAQWEKAARGTDGRLYPWGNNLPTEEDGEFVDLKTDAVSLKLTAPVGSFPKGNSPYGCCDMAGNVMELTCEWEEPYQNNPYADKMLSYTGHTNVCLRGGSFYFGKMAYIAAKRFGFTPEENYYHVGFRTAWTPPADYFSSKAFQDAKAKVPAAKAEIERLRKITNPKSACL